MSLILNQIGIVFIFVCDVECVRDWYCDILGLLVDGEFLFGYLYIILMNGIWIVLDSKIYVEVYMFKMFVFYFDMEDIEEVYVFM